MQPFFYKISLVQTNYWAQHLFNYSYHNFKQNTFYEKVIKL